MSSPNGTCGDEVLAAFGRLEQRQGRRQFTVAEIIKEVFEAGSSYQESTVRTHIVSRMCVDSPDHHASVYPDLERVGRGCYRRR